MVWTHNASATRSRDVAFDEGLRQYMLGVYNYMAAGLALTGIVAFLTVRFEPLLMALYSVTPTGQIAGMSPLGWIISFAPIAMVLFMNPAKLSAKGAQIWFWSFAVIMGLSLSSILLMYTGASVARAFFISAGTFGALSLYGYTTKRDLTSMGTFLTIGVFGVLIASIVNIFMQSPMMYFIISVVGVLLAIGLTAYDTQKVKQIYYSVSGEEARKHASILGAFTLYFDFIYLFIHLVRLIGERR